MARSGGNEAAEAEPTELTPMAVLLASEEGAGITGQEISVDGGYKV